MQSRISSFKILFLFIWMYSPLFIAKISLSLNETRHRMSMSVESIFYIMNIIVKKIHLKKYVVKIRI